MDNSKEMERNRYLILRKKALEKLRKDMEEGRVDSDIVLLLNRINSSNKYYTSSSCSGRIVLIVLEDIGVKSTAEFLGKWHREVDLQEVYSAVEKWDGHGYIFLMIQSPIIHVRCIDEESALKLLNLANSCGFKYSSIKSKYVVEILSTEQLHVPLGKNGEIWVDVKYLERCIEIANKMIRRAKQKIRRLENSLPKILDLS